MAVSLREQLTTTNRGKVPTRDPDRTTGVSVEKTLISPAKRSLEHISGGEAAFRSVLMGAMIGAPITDSKTVDRAITVLDNGTAALHERAVSTFSATLEQAANTVSPEFMLEQVTQVVQTYEQKHDEAWVNTPEETVRRAAEARGYNPDEITGGRSEILLRDLEKIKLQLEAGEKVTAFEILETFIFQSLGRYEDIATGDIVAVWKDGEKEYPSKQDAWEDVLTSQTLLNVMNETLATLAGSQADASDPAAPTATQDPAGDPTDNPTEAPSTPTDKPEPSATPDIATPEPVPTEQQNLDISNEVDQITVIEQTTQSDKYVYVNETTITPPEGVTLEGGRSVFLDNANIQREVIREQGLAPGYTSVHVRSDELVNTVTTFDQAGTSIYVPVISVDGQTFYSSSTSKAYFDVEIPEGAKPKYEAVSLPPNTNPESVTVRFQGEAEILEVTDNVGNQWVWDFRKGEFVSMIDRPATAEMRAALPDYVAAYVRTAQPGQEELFKSPEVVMDRLEGDIDSTGNKILIDPQTGVPLFVKLQLEDGTWKWQEPTLDYFSQQLDITFGTDTVEGPTSRDKELYTQYGSGTVAVGMEWWRVEPEQGKIEQGELLKAQKVISELTEAGVDNINIHAILYPGNMPDWLINGNYTQEELRQIMRARIEYVIQNTPDADSYVVVNEPYDLNNPDRQQDPFYKAWEGFDYITEAFQIARETADQMGRPEVKLIFNDTDNHRTNGGTTQATREIVSNLQDLGLIDFVGMQMHFNEWGGIANGNLDPSIAKEIEYYKEIGVPILITELTYTPTDRELSMNERDFNERLAKIFASIVQVAIDSGNVQGITTWGVTEQYLEGTGWKQLFDENAQPRQAYFEMLRLLFEAGKH